MDYRLAPGTPVRRPADLAVVRAALYIFAAISVLGSAGMLLLLKPDARGYLLPS